MNYKKLTNEEIESFAGVKEFNKMWYLSASEKYTENMTALDFLDTQLAKISAKKYGGTISARTAMIRRTRCNAKKQLYVAKNLD